ncbi:hypothetical protein [Deefgea sp. CFH1-16]|uniref:hypothetical protein n=1 Tax=Deefgea sp. CFH1-16 TaxID=2675457 RepID=UPI0015F41309|nr:hypothetical protein [Deefgea sp. CFH1-16]MBM5575155.1 hypothetical protein [Deefgea sp. CFH1-16]
MAYNILLQINSGKITAVSTGCAGNTIANGDNAICSETGNSNAIVRRVIDLGASLTPASSGISSRGYIDTDVSTTVDLNSGRTTKANCGILFGSGGKDAIDSPDNCDPTINISTGKADKWRPENDPTYCLSSTKGKTGADKTTFDGANASTKIDSALAGQSGDEFFASYFGGLSKAEVKAAASNNGVVVFSCSLSNDSTSCCRTSSQNQNIMDRWRPESRSTLLQLVCRTKSAANRSDYQW